MTLAMGKDPPVRPVALSFKAPTLDCAGLVASLC